MPRDSIEFLSPDDTILELNYPYNEVQKKITSMSFDKQPLVKGILIGIKGQYLIFEGGNVIN